MTNNRNYSNIREYKMGLLNRSLISPLVKRLGLSNKDVANNEGLLVEYGENSKEIEKLEAKLSTLYSRQEHIEEVIKVEVKK